MTPVDFAERYALSSDMLARCETYAAMLRKWSGAINLVARSTLDDLWERHFADSAQLLDLSPTQTRDWIDLGSGAGFPGMVVAILAMERQPALRVTLVESDRRKAAFLREVARETGTAVEVLPARVEALDRRADTISARAFAPLTRLLPLSEPLCHDATILLLPKGRDADRELTEAAREWHMEVERFPSAVDPAGVVFRIARFSRRDHV